MSWRNEFESPFAIKKTKNKTCYVENMLNSDYLLCTPSISSCPFPCSMYVHHNIKFVKQSDTTFSLHFQFPTKLEEHTCILSNLCLKCKSWWVYQVFSDRLRTKNLAIKNSKNKSCNKLYIAAKPAK